ncbi:MAG: sigma-70 family RNA polymerase sigma factor [Pirellulales bacterium]
MPERDPQPDEFVRLFMANQRRILAYVATMVPNLADAEDIVQEASSVMWAKFDEFTPGSQFHSWAFKIAHYKVLEYRRREGRDKLVFSEGLLEQIAAEASEQSSEMESQSRFLGECLQELTPTNRRLIEQRYQQGAKIKDLAVMIGRSVVTVRKQLQASHAALLECVERKRDQETDA